MNAFTPQLIAGVRLSIQQRADRLLDEMERKGTCDFVSEFPYPLPSAVFFDLLGLPSEYHGTIRESSQGSGIFPSSVYRRDFNAMEEIAKQLTAAEDVLQRLIRERRREA